MSSGMIKQRTFALSKLTGPTSCVAIRVRVINLSQLLLTKNGDMYAKAWAMDNDGSCMEVCFWHINEQFHAQLEHLQNRVVVMEAVAIRARSDGKGFGINFTGSVPPADRAKFSYQTTHSSISEVAEDASYPITRVEPVERVEPARDSLWRLDEPFASPARSNATTLSPKESWNPALMRPQELVQFQCLACHVHRGSHLPSCPMTGKPHPQICGDCHMLMRPVLDFCPETGKAHT